MILCRVNLLTCLPYCDDLLSLQVRYQTGQIRRVSAGDAVDTYLNTLDLYHIPQRMIYTHYAYSFIFATQDVQYMLAAFFSLSLTYQSWRVTLGRLRRPETGDTVRTPAMWSLTLRLTSQ